MCTCDLSKLTALFSVMSLLKLLGLWLLLSVAVHFVNEGLRSLRKKFPVLEIFNPKRKNKNVK